jgi:hypothetical protein
VAQEVRGDDEVLIGRQMGLGLPGDAFQDQKRLRAVKSLAAPGQKQGSRLFAPLLQPLIEHVPVRPLDGNEPLHVPTLSQDIHKVMFQICCYRFHTNVPNSSRLTNNPITISCRRIDLETQMGFRTKRFSQVRTVRCFRSIFCVCVLPTVWCSGSR